MFLSEGQDRDPYDPINWALTCTDVVRPLLCPLVEMKMVRRAEIFKLPCNNASILDIVLAFDAMLLSKPNERHPEPLLDPLSDTPC